ACRAWRWRTGRAPAGIVPPLADRLSESLDRVRYFEDKQRFFAADATAQYLTSQIATDPAPRTGPPARGSFAWVQQEAGLDRVDAFVLALSLSAAAREMRVIPLLLPAGAATGDLTARIGELSGRPVTELRGPASAQGIAAAVTLCWLDGADLVLRAACAPEKVRLADVLTPLGQVPVNVFVAAADRAPVEGVPHHLLFPPVEVPPLTYAQRVEIWKRALGSRAEALASTVAETARRFRYEGETIERIAEGLRAMPGALLPAVITSSCRAAARLEIGDLAQRVTP